MSTLIILHKLKPSVHLQVDDQYSLRSNDSSIRHLYHLLLLAVAISRTSQMILTDFRPLYDLLVTRHWSVCENLDRR